MSPDEIYMLRCFELARKGLGLTRTNPLVGCVIVHEGRIIGEGYHHEFGGPHAEVNAFRSVRETHLLQESTLYTNLEPCSHFGKTPPCSMLIKQRSIRRVVISNHDPNPQVDGEGINYLRTEGIEVTTGILEKEGLNLNRRFFVFHNEKRPFVILKWAQTADGFLDLIRQPEDPVGPNWITDEVSRSLIHKWRTEEAGIMIGTNTVLVDNPILTVRRWTGIDPVRITFDRNGRLFEGLHILDGSQETIVFTSVPVSYSQRVKVLQIDYNNDLSEAMNELYQLNIISIMVEGGKELLNSFIESGYWDEARVFTGKVKFDEGIKAPGMDKKPVAGTIYQGSRLEVYENN